MTSLLDQFIAEGYDLLEVADAGLLRLERAPKDEDAINGLFRAVHTLKGSAGLFDLPAFIRLVHAGEDLLVAVRAGRLALTPGVADPLLETLDVVRSWLDVLADTEALPADANDISRELAERLRAHIPGLAESSAGVRATATTTSEPPPEIWEWVDRLPESARRAALTAALTVGRPLLAVRYVPDSQCFFSGEDPLFLVRQIPEPAALGVDTERVWPSGEDLDPHACVVRFGLLSLASRAEVEHAFRYVAEQVRIDTLTPESLIRPSGEDGIVPVHGDFLDGARVSVAARDDAGLARAARALIDLSNPALRASSVLRWLSAVLEAPRPDPVLIDGLLRAMEDGRPPRWDVDRNEPVIASADPGEISRVLLADQRRLLSSPMEAIELQGRIASAGLTLSNALAAAGDDEGRRHIETLTAAARAAGSPEPLLAFLDRRLGNVSVIPEASKPDDEGAGNGNGDVVGHGPIRALRVDQAKIDLLMNLIGELVVAKNGLPFLARRAERIHGSREMARDIKDQYAVFDRLAQEMRGAIMQVRMLPVAQMFQRFPRLVRDLARKLDKNIDLVVSGEETEADKNIIESLGDPLLHIVRNAVDHGIETADERRAAGKPEIATIRLNALQDADTVVIEISDDGRGIDPERVKAKAVEKGVIDERTADALSDDDAVQLVFRPGFSTVDTITDLSGRGVGMDVVRTAVEKEGGRVSLSSRLGFGTTVGLRLPLSMAVSRVMVVEVAGTAFGIPMDIVVETVRVPRARIRAIKRNETLVLRDTIVPLVRLARSLGLPETAHDRDDEAVLVARIADRPVGLVIDQFKEGIEIILKPMEGILAGIPGLGGTAILGDGRVLPVLNLKELL